MTFDDNSENDDLAPAQGFLFSVMLVCAAVMVIVAMLRG